MKEGQINSTTLRWDEINELDLKDSKPNVDYYILSENFASISLVDSQIKGKVLTGIRFVIRDKSLQLSTMFKNVDRIGNIIQQGDVIKTTMRILPE